MTDPNSNDPQVPETPQDPKPPTPPEPAASERPASEPESARTEPYDAGSESGKTVDTEAREAPHEEKSSAEQPPKEPAKEAPPEKMGGDHPWAMACHLSALANLCCPVLGFVGTMVIWQMNRKDDPEVDWHGKEALNFQLNLLPIVMILIVMIALERSCFIFGVAFVLLPLVLLGALIYVLIASIRAAEGVRYRYPHIKRLLD